MNALQKVIKVKSILAALTLLGASHIAQAATVVYEDVSFFNGVGTQSDAFKISTAGTYKATLTDFKFPNTFTANFGLLVGTSNTEMGETLGAGSFMFDAAPGTYWASIYGVTDAPLNLGLFGVRIEQLSSAVAAPVPLPGGLLLLASALAAYAGFGRGGVKMPGRSNEFRDDLVPA